MAISNKDCTLLFYSRTLGVSFENTLMLGRQKLNVSDSHLQACARKYGGKYSNIYNPVSDGYSEPLFIILGADNIQSLDYSTYEGATLIHDMNVPVLSEWHSNFSVIVDGGTIEHIFNFPVAIKNVMKMLKTGGHFIGISPANNQMGHGFFQFSPELYYSVFSKENGFAVKKMLITTLNDNGSWFEVADPAVVRSRVMITNGLPLSIIVIAEKISVSEIFKNFPQQSDYKDAWNIATSLSLNTPIESEGKLKFFYRKFIPKSLKIIIRYIYDIVTVKEIDSDEFGAINTNHFKKIEL